MQVEREVLQIFMKTLQHTEPELAHCVSGSSQHILLCLRAGDSHYRLASLYHHSIRSGSVCYTLIILHYFTLVL